MLSMEGVEPLGTDPQMFDIFWELGVRLVALTWNTRNSFADGAGEPDDGGLSRLGRELVRLLVEYGAVLDVAHASKRTFEGVFSESDNAVVICSHGGCRAIYDTPRNLDDSQLQALSEGGGVMGLMAHPVAVRPGRPTLDHYVDRIDHAVSVMGIEHVGIGADFIKQVAFSGAIPDPGRGVFTAGRPLQAGVSKASRAPLTTQVWCEFWGTAGTAQVIRRGSWRIISFGCSPKTFPS